MVLSPRACWCSTTRTHHHHLPVPQSHLSYNKNKLLTRFQPFSAPRVQPQHCCLPRWGPPRTHFQAGPHPNCITPTLLWLRRMLILCRVSISCNHHEEGTPPLLLMSSWCWDVPTLIPDWDCCWHCLLPATSGSQLELDGEEEPQREQKLHQ